MAGVAQVANRGTFYFEQCRTQPDKVLVYYLPPVGMFAVPPRGPIECNDEYSYVREAHESAQYDPSLLSKKYQAAAKAECSAGAADIADDMAFLGSVRWNTIKDGTEVRLQKSYFGSDGSLAAAEEPYSDHDLKLTLDIVPGEDIHAEPGGPYTIQRADTVTLDGTQSVPSKNHHITSYEWELTPKGSPSGCSGIGRTATMTGATVSFVALCSVDVMLTVKDDGEKRIAVALRLS